MVRVVFPNVTGGAGSRVLDPVTGVEVEIMSAVAAARLANYVDNTNARDTMSDDRIRTLLACPASCEPEGAIAKVMRVCVSLELGNIVLRGASLLAGKTYFSAVDAAGSLITAPFLDEFSEAEAAVRPGGPSGP